MNGTEKIERILADMDIAKLTKILNEAKIWIEQNLDQVRDQLRDSSQLAYALYCIPDILDQKIQDHETGVDSFAHNRYQSNQQGNAFSNQQVYKNSQMQGVFLNFQEDETPAQTQTPSAPNYEPHQSQSLYYTPPSNMHQYPQYHSYQQGNYQDSLHYQSNPPPMSYSTDQSSQAYAPTYENDDAELYELANSLTQEQINSLPDEDLKKEILEIRKNSL